MELRDVLKIKPRPELLRLLADYIVTIPDSHFDMTSFCGTARCAFGHAPSVPEIRATGLRIAFVEDGDSYMTLRKRDESAIDAAIDGYVDNFVRAQFVFGITSEEAGRVFDGHVKSQKMVAYRLRRLAAKYEGKKKNRAR